MKTLSVSPFDDSYFSKEFVSLLEKGLWIRSVAGSAPGQKVVCVCCIEDFKCFLC